MSGSAAPPTAAVRVKICGLTRPDDAMHAATAGADYLGLNLWPGSKRHVDVARAAELAVAARAARPTVAIVGVFVDADLVTIVAAVTAAGLDVVQLHGREPAALTAALIDRGLTVWRAAAMATDTDVHALAGQGAHAYLLDTPTVGHGGSGRTFDWRLAAAAVAAGHRVLLAGGLDPANVGAAIAQVRPWAVDVASGVEAAPGIKDPDRVDRFLAAARAAAGATLGDP